MAEWKKTLEYDPLTKTETVFGYEESSSGRESDDSVVIQTKTDVTDIIESNKRQFNETDRHQSHGSWSKVASIPLVLMHELKQKGILNDQKALKKWLNDPDNRHFRTRGSRL